MGHVRVNLTLAGPKGRCTLRRILVDTGATFTVVDPETVTSLGLPTASRRVRIELGNGRFVRAQCAFATARIGRREMPTVVVAFRGAKPVLGAETLEALGLGVDPRRGRLIAERPSAHALYYGTTSFRR